MRGALAALVLCFSAVVTAAPPVVTSKSVTYWCFTDMMGGANMAIDGSAGNTPIYLNTPTFMGVGMSAEQSIDSLSSRSVCLGLNHTDLSGKTFGRLTVTHFSHLNTKRRSSYWHCTCVCGKSITVRVDCLNSGKAMSCGCLRDERRNLASTKHGRCPRGAGKATEYSVWVGMIQRCTNPKAKGYHRYGGSGISVCQRWADSFADFLADVGPRPSLKYTLDRVEGSKGYEPGNVRWATHSEQTRNMKRNVNITLGDRTQCLQDWANSLGMSANSLKYRISKWGIERALTIPRTKPYRGKS